MSSNDITAAGFDYDIDGGYTLYSAMQTRYEQRNSYTKYIEWSLIYLNDDINKPVVTVTRKSTITINSIRDRTELPKFGLAKNVKSCISRCDHDVSIDRPIRYDNGNAIYKKPANISTQPSGKYELKRTKRNILRVMNSTSDGKYKVKHRLENKKHKRTLFVKNLPRTADRDDIREIADQFGRVMRVSLIKSKTEPFDFIGRAFIEYRTSAIANEALSKWNDTYIDDLKIEAIVSKPKKFVKQ